MLRYVCILKGLDVDFTEANIIAISKCDIQPSKIYMARDNGVCAGFAFAEYSSRTKLLKAIDFLSRHLPYIRIEEYHANRQ